MGGGGLSILRVRKRGSELGRSVYQNQEKRQTGKEGEREREIGVQLEKDAGKVAASEREGGEGGRQAVLHCQPAAPSGALKCIRPVHWEAAK